MASLYPKKVSGKTYWYLREMARVDGKPKMVSERYLGTAAEIAAAVEARETAVLPERTRHLAFGDVAAGWALLGELGVIAVIDQAAGPRPAGQPLSTGTYLALAALNRLVAPCSKAQFADWWKTTAADRFTKIGASALDGRRFWDAMHAVTLEARPPDLSNTHLACRLTCAFASCLERGFPLRCFSHVVAGCRAAVLRPWWPAWAGLPGFRCTGRLGSCRADVPKSPADAGRGQPPVGGGAFPGQAQVLSERPGETELGMGGDGWVGPGRPAEIAPGGFPRPARRTPRANYSAPGAPRVLSAGQLPVVAAAGFGVHGVGMLLPRCR